MHDRVGILAKLPKQENPPQRHRDHRGEPDRDDEYGFGFVLRALCVSVVQISAGTEDLIVQNKANLPGDEVTLTCGWAKSYAKNECMMGLEKQSQLSTEGLWCARRASRGTSIMKAILESWARRPCYSLKTPHGVTTSRRVVQNKANSWEAGWMRSPFSERSCDKMTGLRAAKKQSQFPGRGCLPHPWSGRGKARWTLPNEVDATALVMLNEVKHRAFDRTFALYAKGISRSQPRSFAGAQDDKLCTSSRFIPDTLRETAPRLARTEMGASGNEGGCFSQGQV